MTSNDSAGVPPGIPPGPLPAGPLPGPPQPNPAFTPTDGEAKRSSARTWGPLVIAGLLVVASLGTAFYFYRDAATTQQRLDAQEDARDAACAYAPTLANYDFNDLDTYFGAVLEGATGAWKDEFEDTSKELRDVLAQGKVVSKASEVQCALQTGDEDRAQAVVVIGQSVSSVGTEGKEQPGQLSMVLSLEHHDGRWLVSKLDSPLLSAKQ